MTDQALNEIIKSLAYGETPEQIAEAEGVSAADVQQIAVDHVDEIQAEQEMLRRVGYLT